METYISTFLISILISYLMTPIIKKLAVAVGAVDYPNQRRINTSPVPTIGGLAIYAGFLTAVIMMTSLSRPLTGILLGGSIILLVGLLDDLYELSPRVKLAGQILSACVLILFGVKVQFITNPFGGMIFLGYWGIPLTILWVVGITNTVNLVDGLDGLAAGISAIAALILFLIGLQEGQVTAAVMAVALAGSLLAFLRFNFNPAEIFMGDTGAMFIGFMLAAVSVLGALKSAAAITLVVPILALGVPIFDMLFAIVRRIYNGKPVGEADHGHIHHRLLALGMNQRQAVLSVYAISIGLGLMALVINGIRLQTALIILGVVLTGLVYGAWRLGIFSVELPADGAGFEKGNL